MAGPAVEALALEGVRLDYPGRPGVLSGVDLRVRRGELVVLQGRSGSGKSSLLAVASGLEAPSGGRVLVEGVPVEPAAAAALRAARIGLVFQHLNLLGELTVAENVELPLRLARRPAPERQARVAELLALFGLQDLAQRRPGTLSGGEQQRVAIARALAPRPALLLADEPTSHLDAENAQAVVAALRTAAQAGAGVLVATHDEILRGAGRTVRLEGGRVLPATGAAAPAATPSTPPPAAPPATPPATSPATSPGTSPAAPPTTKPPAPPVHRSPPGRAPAPRDAPPPTRPNPPKPPSPPPGGAPPRPPGAGR